MVSSAPGVDGHAVERETVKKRGVGFLASRDGKGRFVAGCAGGPGRPKKVPSDDVAGDVLVFGEADVVLEAMIEEAQGAADALITDACTRWRGNLVQSVGGEAADAIIGLFVDGWPS